MQALAVELEADPHLCLDKIIEYLNKVGFPSAVNMDLTYHSLIRKLCEGTTEWFVARAEFQDWATGVVSSLWVKGKGKLNP
jgi:hypothetical protein